ncbi:MAG TPA: penicillin-binding transpeptidase domain-containing protein, partial [Bryobacteraceae bacterium]|nr:penicillin-binding transpeptidase domain-containing protein [Bryobacteraceae bacterium]
TGRGVANLKGYTSGGKTGTAQVYDAKTKSYTHRYNASFLGFAPVTNPQIVVAVTLNDTTGGTAGYGGPVAAPVFSKVAMSALRMLDVPKDLPDTMVTSSRVDRNGLAIASLGDGNEDSSISTGSSVSAQPPAASDTSPSSEASDKSRRPFLSRAQGPRVASQRPK